MVMESYSSFNRILVFLAPFLFKACENGHADVVQLLAADRRINPSIQENVAARAAKWKGYSEIVNIFLEDPRLDDEGRARLRKDLHETSDGFGSRGVVWGGQKQCGRSLQL
jgi:hypothetical protein